MQDSEYLLVIIRKSTTKFLIRRYFYMIQKILTINHLLLCLIMFDMIHQDF